MSNRIKNQFLTLSFLGFALLGSFSNVATADTTARTAPMAQTQAEKPAGRAVSATTTKPKTAERQVPIDPCPPPSVFCRKFPSLCVPCRNGIIISPF